MIVAIRSGGDWFDADVNHVVLLNDGHPTTIELFEQYKVVEKEPYMNFHIWLIQNNYARVAEEEEIEIFDVD